MIMDTDIQEAKALYEANLASVEEALQEDPANVELMQVRTDLHKALQEINSLEKTSLDEVDNIGDIDGEVIADESGVSRAVRPRQPPAAVATTATASNNNNARIHPRSIYATEEPDFASLSVQYPSLQQYLLPAPPGSTRQGLDFTNPYACRELTKVLLAADFGITWDVPDGQLVPPLTNRLNYIHWIDDLLSLSRPLGTTSIRGLDVGCGANIIYPLLGAAVYQWKFVGVDVTPVALEWAQRNLDSNPQLEGLIEVRKAVMQPGQQEFFSSQDPATKNNNATTSKVPPKAPTPFILETPKETTAAAAASSHHQPSIGILSGALREGESFAFCMCNPPFFESIEEAGRNPSTAFGGTPQEMIYPGGEIAFITNMVHDSVLLCDRIHWYTTMVGKKATLKAVRTLLYSLGVAVVVRTTEFYQGKTSRWGIAWSFAANPEAANKPLPRSAAAAASVPCETSAAAPAKPDIAKRIKVGRKVSMQVHVSSAGAAADVLATVRRQLEGTAGLECKILADGFTLSASPRDNAQPGEQEGHVAKRAKLSNNTEKEEEGHVVAGLQAQLLMQHSKLFMLTLSLEKAAPQSALSWFADIITDIERALSDKCKVS